MQIYLKENWYEPVELARYKYILRRGQIVGYYSGFTFANQAGLTTQVPVTIGIVSNEASAKVRDVDIKGQTIRLRKQKRQ